MSEAQVKVRFFTKEDDETLHASDAPLFVPASLKRYGLSEVVNHLLLREEQVPFDFLIDGALLRTSVEEYLVKNGLSSESFLQIEYARAVLPPSFLGSFNDEDWVLSIDTINPNSKAVSAGRSTLAAPQILAGSYDGVVRTYTMSGQVETQYVGHLAAVKAVKWVYAHRIVSGGLDRQIRIWKTKASETDVDDVDDDDEPGAGRTVAILDAHTAPVLALDVNQSTHRILSGGADSVVGVWSTVPKDMSVVEPYSLENASSAAKKRRRLALKDLGVKHRGPLAVLEGHSQAVEGVVFDQTDSSVAYTVSQDHTVKTWDLVTLRCVDTRATGFSLLSVVQLPEVNLIACGLSARHITLHDPRVQSGATEMHTTKLVGHTNFVVDLAACPTNGNMFASASHDGTVKVWDVRAEKAMYTIARESGAGKVFGVAWDREIGLVSGGEDKKVQINKGSDIAK